MEHHIDHHIDRVKFLMSKERKHQHNPETILNEAGAKKGMTMADLGSGPGFFTIPMAQMTGETREKLVEKGFDVVGEFSCRGFSDYHMIFKLFGGVNKGHPNNKGLDNAKTFVLELNGEK
jgi:hypothetical protein